MGLTVGKPLTDEAYPHRVFRVESGVDQGARSEPTPSPNYVPKDLVPLQDYRVATLGSDVLLGEAAENLGRWSKRAILSHNRLVAVCKSANQSECSSSIR